MTPSRVAESGSPMTGGNLVDLFTDGQALARASEEAITSARRRVWIETFILGVGGIGRRFIDLAADAARRGCDVRVIVDHLGSPITGFGLYGSIKSAGGHALLYNPLPPWRSLGRRSGPLYHRDHRKILICDDLGFCGGHNLSDDYLSSDPVYHDTTIRIRGPATADLAAVFLQTFALASGGRWEADSERIEPAGDVPVAIHPQDLHRRIDAADRALARMLTDAQERCSLMIAYYVPPPWLTEALVAAARRGVRVQLMTAGNSDIPPAREGGRHTYGDLLSAGVQVYELLQPRLHAKNVTVDGRYGLVGSYDFNGFSGRHSLEVTAMVRDRAVAAALEETFANNVRRSREVALAQWQNRPWWQRAVQRASHRLFFF